jgi:hypothetical protein
MICARSPGAAMQRSCRLGGSAAITGTASGSPRRTYLRRTKSSAQEPSGFVVELFADLLTDQASILRSHLHFFGIDDLLNDRQIRSHRSRQRVSRLALGSCRGSASSREEAVDFSRFALRSHQEEIEVAGIQLFARTAEHTPDEQVYPSDEPILAG